MTSQYQVAIVGYGPVGATLANLLGQAGVSTVVIDREASHYHLPRAVHFDDEVQRVFQTIGLGDEVAATLRVNPGMRFVDTGGKLLLDWPRPQEITQHGWHASYRFHQPDLEVILRKGVERFDCVELKLETEVTSLTDNGDCVELTCTNRASGQSESISADYVVGCDGANSVVRRIMNPEMEDYGFNERWLVIDLLLKKDKPELGDHSIQYCNPERPATYVRSPLNRRRWEIRLDASEDTATASNPDYVWKLLSQWITPDEAELERAAVYTFNSKVVKTWTLGRLSLAGDAAHLTPPFMGQGMCAGIRDVSNLGWKLIQTVQGRANAKLLKTYGSERFNNAAEYVKTAVRLGGLINTAGTEEALRAALKPAKPEGAAKMESIAPAQGPGIEAGSSDYHGYLFGQPKLLDGTLSDDHFGYEPVLFIDAGKFSNEAIEAAQRANFKVLTTDESSDLRAHLEKRDTCAVLAKPDRYIVGTAKTDAELASLCGWDKEFAVS